MMSHAWQYCHSLVNSLLDRSSGSDVSSFMSDSTYHHSYNKQTKIYHVQGNVLHRQIFVTTTIIYNSQIHQ